MRNFALIFGRSFVSWRNIYTKGCKLPFSTGYFSIISYFASGIPSFSRGLSQEACFLDNDLQTDVFNVFFCALIKSPLTVEDFFTELEIIESGEIRTASCISQRGKEKTVGRKLVEIFLIDREKAADTSCRFLQALIVSTESLPSRCYLKFASCFTNIVDSTPLLKLVNDVVNELPIFRGRVFVNRIIFAFGELKQLDKALSIFNWMRRTNVSPDLVTYNIILEILGRAGRVHEMLEEFETMNKVSIFPDFISYNTILNQLRKAGRLDLCLIHYKNMLQNGIQPDLLTFTALIESLGRSGNVDEALKVFAEMKSRRICPSIYIYRSLIKNLKKMGMIQLALTMAEEMNSSSLARPNDFKRKGSK